MKKMQLIGAVAAAAICGSFALSSLASAETPATADPQKHESFCTDRYAREIGRLTYLETKINPTGTQKAAWDKYEAAVTADAKAHESKCLTMAPMFGKDGKRPTIIERQSMEQKFLEARLESLKATSPSLSALYASLNDTQKQTLDQSSRRMGGHHRGGWGGHHRGGEHHGPRNDGPDAPDGPQEN